MSADGLTLRFRVSLPGFELDIDEMLPLAGVTAVFGPSGSGKSTLLRAIAGFEVPAAGRIACGPAVWFERAAGVHVAPHRRPVGYMFQDARLFPHLDVAGNLAYAARRSRGPLPGVDLDAVAAALDLRPLLRRDVDGLSGGERRRVALGRTLLRAPRLLLLDEPLTGLDVERKSEILPYLERIPQQFHIPTLYVSHDVDEVARLADRMLVLAAGRVQVHAATAAAMESLDLQPALGRYEAGVLLTGRVTEHDTRLHLTRIEVAGHALSLPLVERVPVGDLLRVRVRARDVALAVQPPTGLSIRNVIAGSIADIRLDDHGVADVRVELSGAHLRARVTLAAVEALELRAGMPVHALIKSVSFDRML